MTIGQRLKYLMDKAEIKAYALSNATKISQSTIGYYLKDKPNPSKANILIIARYFDVEFGWLYNGIGNPPENIVVPEKSKNIKTKGKEYETKSEKIIIEDFGKCESCKKLNNRIEFLEDLLRDRDTEIARLNQEIGQLKLNQIEPKKGKAHYG